MDEVLPWKDRLGDQSPCLHRKVFSDSVFSGSVTEPLLKTVN